MFLYFIAQPDGSSESEEEDDEDITLTKKTFMNRKTLNKGRKITHDSNDDEDEFDTEFHRPSEVTHKQNKKKAMDVLLSKRRDKKEGLLFLINLIF